MERMEGNHMTDMGWEIAKMKTMQQSAEHLRCLYAEAWDTDWKTQIKAKPKY